MKFISKPTTVEAIQWDGASSTVDRMRDAHMPVYVLWVEERVADLSLLAGVDGAQDRVPVPVGHWVVRAEGVLNDHWPVEDGYFRAKYDVASDGQTTIHDFLAGASPGDS